MEFFFSVKNKLVMGSYSQYIRPTVKSDPVSKVVRPKFS